jgi:hypothetical protein
MVATDVASRGIGMIESPSPAQQRPVAYTVVLYSRRLKAFP